MNSKWTLIAGIFIIVLISCTIEKFSLPYQGINIFAVLNNRADTQRIYIDSIAGIETSSDSVMSIGDAKLFINDTKLAYRQEDSLASGYYEYMEPIISGDEYTLQLYYNTDTIIRGTIIPDPVNIIFPIEGFPLPMDTFTILLWSGKSYMYGIDIRKSGDSIPTMMMYQLIDTIVPLFAFSQFLDSGEYYDFTVSAIDSNYMMYLFGNDDLDGNKGVFGSFVSSTVESIQVITLP